MIFGRRAIGHGIRNDGQRGAWRMRRFRANALSRRTPLDMSGALHYRTGPVCRVRGTEPKMTGLWL
jgi:hypothetical protein